MPLPLILLAGAGAVLTGLAIQTIKDITCQRCGKRDQVVQVDETSTGNQYRCKRCHRTWWTKK